MDREEFMTGALAAFIRWAATEKRMLKAHSEATGMPMPSTRRLEALIDNVTELQDAWARSFIEWVTVNHWGEDDAPEGWRDLLEAERDV